MSFFEYPPAAIGGALEGVNKGVVQSSMTLITRTVEGLQAALTGATTQLSTGSQKIVEDLVNSGREFVGGFWEIVTGVRASVAQITKETLSLSTLLPWKWPTKFIVNPLKSLHVGIKGIGRWLVRSGFNAPAFLLSAALLRPPQTVGKTAAELLTLPKHVLMGSAEAGTHVQQAVHTVLDGVIPDVNKHLTFKLDAGALPKPANDNPAPVVKVAAPKAEDKPKIAEGGHGEHAKAA